MDADRLAIEEVLRWQREGRNAEGSGSLHALGAIEVTPEHGDPTFVDADGSNDSATLEDIVLRPGFTTTEDWSIEYDGTRWWAKGSRSGTQEREPVAGEDYTIADIACYPWIVPHQRQRQNLDDFPHLKRWFEAIRSRPATDRH